MRTALYYDPLFLQHDTGSHPENADRLRAILAAAEEQGLTERVLHHPSRAATTEELALVHPADYVAQVEDAVADGRPYLSTPDCVLSAATYEVARQAAGAVAEAVIAVDAGTADNAFVACRPPGHHAEHAEAMGFCFFNNIAVGASLLVEELGYERVLIFDFDVHHGNGTQHTFEADPRVLYVSIHQHPLTCYPGTGFAEERGTGDGVGFTLNAPMPPHADDAAYRQVFDRVLLPRFREFWPQFILISAGFDAHRDDPLARIDLTRAGFDHMLEGITALAAQSAQGRLVSILEGGYHYERLAECATAHLDLLLTDPN